jgi:hypothetical protein
MRRRFAIFALLALGCLAAAATAQGGRILDGNVEFTLNASFAPTALPRSRPAPVTINFETAIATTDGSRPPALRSFEVALNSHGKLDSRGLQVCRATSLQSVSSEVALERCRPALVGHGSFRADVESSEDLIPTSGRVLVFNARRAGKPSILLHLYGTTPVRAAFVLPLAIQHRGGKLGTVLAANVPILAGGVGSITHLQMTIGRRYSYRGRQHSYLSAACEAPANFFGASFPFARGSFKFAGGKTVRVSEERECRVRRPS